MAVKANKQSRRRKQLDRRVEQEDEEEEISFSIAQIALPQLQIYQMPPLPPTIRRILICSIGNPGSYMGTRHSVGHFALQLLASSPFSQYSSYGGLVASGPYSDSYTTTLFQSPSMMNVSGKPVKKAWGEFQKQSARENPLLVILHDELEKSLGQVKLKKSGSTGGHNGLSSIANSLSTKDFVRIGLGIGRPESRDSRDVADYVLTKMSQKEKQILEERAMPLVMGMIDNLGKG